MGLGRALTLLLLCGCYDPRVPGALGDGGAAYAQRTWILRDPRSSPPARGSPKLVYDAAHRQVLLYGGIMGGVEVGDMWAWDGTAWTVLCQMCPPGPRHGHGLVYDSVRQRVVLFGGQSATATTHNDVWEWDGTTWQQQSPGGTVPLARTDVFMAFDSTRGQTVLYGGTTSSGDDGDTYEYDGTRFATIPSLLHPPMTSDFGSAATFDAATGRVLVFGGDPLSDELWGWDGAGWSGHCAACSGIPRNGAALVADPSRGRLVLVGGWNGGDEIAGTWEVEGSTFTAVSTSVPSARDGPAIAFDAGRDVVVLFGGNGNGCGNADCQDTYEFVPAE